jgi:ABC-type glutathione transport system ATPase component
MRDSRGDHHHDRRHARIGFADGVCDRVFMDHGAIVEEGLPSKVLRSPVEERTRRFLSRFTSARSANANVNAAWSQEHSTGSGGQP